MPHDSPDWAAKPQEASIAPYEASIVPEPFRHPQDSSGNSRLGTIKVANLKPIKNIVDDA